MTENHDHLSAQANIGSQTGVASQVQAECSAGFSAIPESGFILVTPLDPRAREWLHTHVAPDATWMGETLVVEPAFMPQLAIGIDNAGFRLTRAADLGAGTMQLR